MPKAKQTYTTGIDQDTSKLKYKNTSYFEAYNFRVITDGGSSTGALENEKGNKLSFKIPYVAASYKLRRINTTNPAGSETITITSGVTVIVNISYNAANNILTNKDLFTIINNDATIQTLVTDNKLNVIEDDNFVYIIGLDATLTVSIIGTDCKLNTIAEAQSDVRICGMGHLDTWIIIFTTSETGANPTSSIGDQIWKLKYDEYANIIEGLNSGFLVPSTHLIYNNQLNLSTYHRIEEPITRYETIKIARVYFTDFHNSVRSINIFDDNLWILPPGNLDIVSDITLSKPIIQSVGVGNIPAGSTVQYAYRLINETQGTTRNDAAGTEHNGDGAIGSGNASVPPLGNSFTGAVGTGSPSSSVTYLIKDIDTDYDIIEHFYIYWVNINNPQIFKFKEEFVPPTGVLTVVHTEISTDIPITALEYSALSNSLIAKTLTSKDDRLVAANIKEPTFEIDFDARAYRSKEGPTPGSGDVNFNIFDSAGTSYPFNTGNMHTIPEEHDAINPYNQEDPDINSNWVTDDQYKYFPGQSYLGGKGPNISYKFNLDREISANNLYALADPAYRPFNSTDRHASGDGGINLSEKHLDGTDITYPVAGEIKNMASAKINSVLRGYSRGEIYRFGITFYDLKGNPSFVRWIADIKFPEIFDSTDDLYSGETKYRLQTFNTSLNTSSLRPLGIEFTVDVSTISNLISGFSIVRVKREESDKTRLGTGLLTHFDYFKPFPGWVGEEGVYGNYYSQDVRSDRIKINGDKKHCVVLSDKPGFTNLSEINGGAPKSIAIFSSPLGQFRNNNNYSHKSRDHIQTVGYYNAYLEAYYYNAAAGHGSLGAWYKMRSYSPVTPILTSIATNFRSGHQKFKINSELQLTGGQILDANNSIFGDILEDYDLLLNASYAMDSSSGASNKRPPLGVGNWKHLIVLDRDSTYTGGPATPTISNWWDAAVTPTVGGITGTTGALYDSGTSSVTPFDGVQQIDNFTDSTKRSSNFLKFKEVSYNRFLSLQYKGNSYLERSKSIYMSTNHFQVVSEASNLGTNFTFKVFGGDVYVTYYDDEYITQYWNNTSPELPYEDPTTQEKMSIGIMYPCETTVNTELRSGLHFSKDRDPGDMGGHYQFEQHHILNSYNQEPNAKTQFFAKDALLNLNAEQRYAIKVSNLKVDGELNDNWKIFLPNNELSVEGVHGQINKIVNLKSKVYFYQDSAIGVVSINDRATQISESGVEIVLGDGAVIDHYVYLSTETGTIHQHSVVMSGNSIYHYDDKLKKLFRMGGQGVEPLTDIKGLSAFFSKIDGSLEENDVTLKNLGVHGTYDRRHNRTIMTFLNYKIYQSTIPNKEYAIGDIIYFGGIYYKVITAFTAPAIPNLPISDPNLQAIVDKSGNPNFLNGFTLSFNELLNSFESFLDYKPNIYLYTGRRLLSVNSFSNPKEVYEHGTGEYGQFYGSYYNSKITLILAPGADIIKVFDNIEYNAEIFINDLDAPTETLKQMRFYNDYQDTGVIPLTLGNTVVKRMRKFRSSIPRDITDLTISPKPRMRDAYIFLELEFENNADNKRLILHDIGLSFRPANM